MFDFEGLFAGPKEAPKPKPKPVAQTTQPVDGSKPLSTVQPRQAPTQTSSQPAGLSSSMLWITPKNQLDTITDHERIAQFERNKKEKEVKLAELKTVEMKAAELQRSHSEAKNYEYETKRIMNSIGGKTSPPPTAQKWGKQTRGQKNQEKMLNSEAAYEKAGNYKRQNMKKGYTERVSSKAGYYRSHFLPNGKRKSFYKKQDEQDDDVEVQGDKYVPDEALAIGTEKMNAKEKLAHQEDIFKIDVEKMAEEDTTTVTKENLVFKLMNDGFKLLLLDKRNVPAQMLEVYEQRTRGLGCLQIPKFLEEEGQVLNEEGRKLSTWNEVLNKHFPLPPLPGNLKVQFHPFQYEFLKALDVGQHCFADFFTGAGKSLIFQFHAAVHPGMTIVVVPLISLMIDQVKKVPVDVPSVCYTSWISFPDRARILTRIKNGAVKVLFVTPEIFASEIAWFVLIFNVKVNLVCIDEAHCVSVHSPSFRHAYALIPDHVDRLRKRQFVHTLKECFDYSQLNHLSLEEEEELAELDASIVRSHTKLKPEPKMVNEEMQIQILCLTATCSKEAKADILEQLRLTNPLLQASQKYIRDNLVITVSKESPFIKNIAKLLELGDIKGKRPVLVYCNFMKVVEGVKNTLSQCGYHAAAFTSMQTELVRMNILQKFLLTDPHQ